MHIQEGNKTRRKETSLFQNFSLWAFGEVSGAVEQRFTKASNVFCFPGLNIWFLGMDLCFAGLLPVRLTVTSSSFCSPSSTWQTKMQRFKNIRGFNLISQAILSFKDIGPTKNDQGINFEILTPEEKNRMIHSGVNCGCTPCTIANLSLLPL